MAKRLHVLEFAKFPLGPPVPGYLIELEDGRKAVVESGLRKPAAGAQRDALANYLLHQGFGPEDAAYTLDVDGTQLVEAELARVGTTVGDIDLLILTHLDFDHSGNVSLFPSAEILVQRAAYWWAQTDGSMRSWPAKFANLEHRLQWRLLDGDTEAAPGILLLDTSGHVPGHQSVLVHLPGGPVLITGDAAFESTWFKPDRTSHPFDVDATTSVLSTRRLLEIAESSRVREVLFGHDAEQWPRVRGTTYE